MRRLGPVWLVVLVGVALGWGAGCARRVERPASKPAAATFQDAYPIRVTATTGMVADVVRAVGGPQVAVEQLMGAGIDPHTYKPTRDDVASLMRADVVFYSGLMLEGRMAEMLERAGANRPVLALAEAVPAELRLGGGAGDGHADPHVWMDVSLWSRTAGEVAALLGRFDPTHAEDYQQRAQAWREQLAGLDGYCREVIGSVPQEARVLVTSHDAFRYFGRAYGIEVEGVQGLSTESEAGLQRINNLVDLLVQRRIPAVFCESSVSQKSITAVVEGAAARGHRVEVLGPLFSDAMGEPGTWEGTYIGMLDHNASMVARGLGGNVPEGGWRGRSGLDGKPGLGEEADSQPGATPDPPGNGDPESFSE